MSTSTFTGPLRKLRIYHTADDTYATSVDSCAAAVCPAGSVDLAYRLIGSGDEKLVFIAGMCVTHQMWEHQVRHLRTNANYSLLLIDNRGSGESSTPAVDAGAAKEACLEPYSVHTLARDVWAVVDAAFAPDCAVHLIGHSMGSMVVQRAALLPRYCHRVSSLTVLCGHDGGWFWNYVPSMILLRSVLEIATARGDVNRIADVYMRLHFTHEFLQGWTLCEETGSKIRRRELLLTRYVRGMLDDLTLNEVKHNRNDDDNDKDDDDGISQTLWGHIATVRSHCLTEQDARILRNATFPKLVVYGRQDHVVVPRASRQLAGRVGAQSVSVHAAHFAMEEAAADINQLITFQVERARSDATRLDKQDIVSEHCATTVYNSSNHNEEHRQLL